MTIIDIIERKGIGHPDTIADNLSENLKKKLDKEYFKQYKKLCHFNVDKTLVSAGEIKKNKFINPVRIVFAGQYTKLLNIDDILLQVVKKTLKVEINRGLEYKIYNFLNQGSFDLTNNFNFKKSNDTSFSVGFKLSKNHKLVKNIGKYLDNLYKLNKFIGTDNKIMLIEKDNRINLYIALAFLNIKNYFKEKKKIENYLKNKYKVNVKINNADTKNIKFITKTGTSLEMGDSGMTGRGNRRNGLITPLMPMTLEAYYGKNSNTHIGRIYQDFAQKISNKKNKNVLLINKIGNDILDYDIFEI
ncbi:MAG: methionine adenosyltransferase [Candidatus ainarchaeum sp.]|nr:methionine adenosyltransferase [Candidatus ainarchaeum sp.]